MSQQDVDNIQKFGFFDEIFKLTTLGKGQLPYSAYKIVSLIEQIGHDSASAEDINWLRFCLSLPRTFSLFLLPSLFFVAI